MLFSGDMVEFDTRASFDVFQRVALPVIRSSSIGASIVDTPFIIGISVWVKCNLLFCYESEKENQ